MFVRIILLCLLVITIGAIQSSEDKNLKNKVVVITGAAEGIGYATADDVLAEGAKFVIMLDIQHEKGILVAEKLNSKHGGSRAIFIPCDIRTDLEEVSYRLWKEFKYIDVLINNAGVLDEDCPEAVVDTNTLATIQWSTNFLQRMRKDKGGKGGTIINLASIFGFMVQPFVPIYTGSKYAVIGFSKSIGHEYTSRRTKVRILIICPGFTDTAMTRQNMVTLDQLEDFKKLRNASQWQKADDVARGIMKVFKTAESGTAWSLIGGNDPVLSPASENMTVAYIDSLT